MNVRITVTIGAGKTTNQRSHTLVMKDVVFLDQVNEAMKTEFKDFFTQQSKLGEEKPKK